MHVLKEHPILVTGQNRNGVEPEKRIHIKKIRLKPPHELSGFKLTSIGM